MHSLKCRKRKSSHCNRSPACRTDAAYPQKINQKNSWSLNLIDHLEDVLQTNFNTEEAGGVGNFQAASCTLDASVKIYGCRVDSIHTEAYRVLSDLSRGGKKSSRSLPPQNEKHSHIGSH
jgi:condensin complex subunit 2